MDKEIEQLKESESFVLATVKWVDGTAEVQVSYGGAKHGWEYCAFAIEELMD